MPGSWPASNVLDEESRVDLIRAWARVAAWVDAQQQVALAAVVAATEDCGLTGDDARHEVGAALRLSPGSAYDTVQRAAALTGRLSDTLAALARGVISGAQANAIATMVEPLDDAVAMAVQATVLAGGPEQTVAETKRAPRQLRRNVEDRLTVGDQALRQLHPHPRSALDRPLRAGHRRANRSMSR